MYLFFLKEAIEAMTGYMTKVETTVLVGVRI